jgi:hypothetical protein
MKITTDENGFVRCFAYIGTLVDGIDVPEPEDIDLFLHQFYAFRLQDGQLVYDSDAYEAYVTEETKEEYRRRREKECFSVINRGQLWYEGITIQQMVELRQWYKAWLKVTETMVIPEKPEWLE